MKYSVIALLECEQKDFASYIQNLHTLFLKRQEPFEIIIVANGSGGFLRNELEKLQGCINNLRAFELSIEVPHAVCLKAGLKESRGEIIVACGSYQQITNDSFPRLLDSLDDETDIVTAWRDNRVDTYFRQFRSIIFNVLVSKIVKAKLHDLNCSVKVFRRGVLEEINLYGNMYRYLPILALKKGLKIKEIKCDHYQQRIGKTDFSYLPEHATRIIDILTLYFNTRFTRKPLRFFSGIGVFFLVIGLILASFIFTQKLIFDHPIGDRPILFLSILSMVLGVQAASVGLLGEIIAFTYGRHRKEYTIDKKI